MDEKTAIKRDLGHSRIHTDPHGHCEERTEEAEDGIFFAI